MTKPLSNNEKARRAAARKQPKTALRANPVLEKVKPASKADTVRAAFLKNPAERPSVVAKATGVDPAYVWDVRENMRRKNIIPRVDPATAKKVAAN